MKNNEQELVYELNISPRASIDSHCTPTSSTPDLTPPPAPLTPATPTPSISLLFSLIPRRHRFLILLPAICTSIIAGGIAPFMTFVVGQAFDAFAAFSTTTLDPEIAKAELLHSVGLAALELVALAFGSLVLGSLTSCLWIWTGEINVRALRIHVYSGVTAKEMAWFDANMGGEETTVKDSEGDGAIGAGGMMAKFSRETDDVRAASSLAAGTLLQYLTTCVACLILAFLRSYQLTFVILSAVPLLTLIQGFAQGIAGPRLAAERRETARAATRVERAVTAIATVKAFNAAAYELASATMSFKILCTQARKLNTVWGLTTALAQFVVMSMFVQGFWFGAMLVRTGRVGAGEVMAVFWACLIATSNLQMCVPQLIALAKGKEAMAALMALVDNDTAPSTPSTPTSPSFPTKSLRPIRPSRCTGELALYNVSFSYPSRPSVPVLSNVSLFLPAGEMTFIVGGSGSGKSTVAALLGGMYRVGGASGSSGMVALDEQDLRFLDPTFVREHVACVSQAGGAGAVILSGRSILDNLLIAMAADEQQRATPAQIDAQVEEALRMAMLREWVAGLENGVHELLGGDGGDEEGQGGIGLSGGQKQRLALARARLRNPTVLVLDEATSALDHPTRLLIFAALKRWRANKTTIVITHDLSQIEAEDFVYVMKSGRVVEQGYRGDLEGVGSKEPSSPIEQDGRGEFRKMMEAQRATGGYLPEKDLEPTLNHSDDEDDVDEEEEEEEEEEGTTELQTNLRPLTFGNWMFEVVADLTGVRSGTPAPPSDRTSRRLTLKIPTGPDAQSKSLPNPIRQKRRPSSIQILDVPMMDVKEQSFSKRYSLPFTPTSPTNPSTPASAATVVNRESRTTWAKGYDMENWDEEEDDQFEKEKTAVERSGRHAKDGRFASEQRRARTERRRWVDEDGRLTSIKVVSGEKAAQDQDDSDSEVRPAFFKLMRAIWPSVPHKPLLLFGCVICILSGAMTPVFSFLLSRLLFEVSIGAKDTHAINKFGALVLGTAALDGILLGTKYFIMETCGMLWTTRIRTAAFSRILAQDKKWFDRSRHAPERLTQVLVRDGDDARNLISVVWSQFFVVAAMLGVGLTWALVRGWQLTLAGFAIAPVFAGVMAVQTRLVARCEVRNKRAREAVARGYYESIVHVRGIRSMAFEPVFQRRFESAADRALVTGVRGAFVEGCTYGVASGLIYLAEALLFYVGAVLIAQGTYSYLQMVEVLNLVVFSVTIGSQLMAFTEKIAKSVQATADFNKLMNLDTNTDESRGKLLPDLSYSTDITFNNVNFAYPERPSVPVLKDVNLNIRSGECVAIVGASGSGKSTLAALLQRLYEPTQGHIELGAVRLADIDVRHLRENVSVVSQQPNLFDASIEENIRYGSGSSSADEPTRWVDAVDVRRAAKKANVHDFIMELPQGYDTMVGENAALISGGQAQRLQIARALARPSRVLILDECTSALDAENQAVVLETIGGLTHGEEQRTTVMVTHKLQVMRMCDRIVVLQDGEVKETGTYEELVERKGVFASLASGGEWVGE